ncbi:hypothetical protein ACFPOG_12990 [Paenibacillus aestuarii]|uniref:Uncharacterized protein n=1 Tax=Paenibacillus aestuarii TaxID=516965 RepID=A0ABW0K7F1_9BACL
MEIVKGRGLEYGQIVKVYKNLNRDCFSIQDSRTGLVVAYASTVTVRNVVFRVQDGGRKKTIEINRRSVHAYLQGEFIAADEDMPVQTNRVGYYNPFKTETFIDEGTREIIRTTPLAHCQNHRVHFE